MAEFFGLQGLPTNLDERPSFTTLIAYEDLETGKHAKQTCDVLEQRLGRECEFSTRMWKFDALGVPRLREVAVQDAVTSDLLIFSMHGGRPLPGAVDEWIESWLEQGTGAIALVALFSSESNDNDAVRQYLSDISRRGDFEFFAQSNRSLTSDSLLSDRVDEWTSTRTLVTPGGVVTFRNDPGSVIHWGLNE